jgi:hypothetical protein
LAVRPLNWDEIVDEDDDGENRADPRAPSGGRSHPGDDIDNDDGEGEEDTQGGEKGTGKGKWTKDGKGKRKGKGEPNGKGTGIVKLYEADPDTEGKLERVYLEPEASPTVSSSSDADTESIESDGEYDSELDSAVDRCMEDDVDAPDGVDLDGDVNMEWDGDDE